MNHKISFPDYKNSIACFANSILKKFEAGPVGDTLPLLDKYLNKDYKNVVVFLLDGMGKVILERHLKENGAFRSHLAGIYSSVFPPTTVAATTSIKSGLEPCEHCWLGWDCYYPEIDKNVGVFRNLLQNTEEQAAEYNVAETLRPYEKVVDKINNAGKYKAYACTSFDEPYPQSFEEILDNVKTLCKNEEQKYIYAYWTNPDHLIHENGVDSSVVEENLLYLENQISSLVNELDDTLFIVTADHGHVDNEFVYLKDYPILCDCLERWPSMEPRAINLFIKEDKKQIFEVEFKKEFGNKFLLYKMEEALEKNLFGVKKHNEKLRSMLGNYIAIATDNLTIYFNDDEFITMHGGLTEDEMLIPLIVFKRD